MTDQNDEYSGSPSAASCLALEVPEREAGSRLDQVLARLLPEHSRNRLQAWVKAGRIHVDDALCADPNRKMRGGEQLRIEAEAAPQQSAETAEDLPLRILYRDADILVVDKPAGLVVHPGSGNWSGTMLNALLHHAPQVRALPRAGIVHRLDKDTSGLLVVALNEIAQTDLVRQLQARTVKRHYLALARGRVAHDQLIDAAIGRHPTQRTRMAVVQGAREARTRLCVRERFASSTLIECQLETGRTHQIRVHLAHLGHPLVGDATYGGQRGLPVFARQALHAWRLGLIHPRSGEPLQWEVPIPDDFAQLLAGLRGELLPCS